MVKVSSLLFILAAIASSNAAIIRRASGTPGLVATVENQDTFCTFLPKEAGGNIGDSESDAFAFCTQANLANAPGGHVLPDGFITSAHFLQKDSYVQVTGTINPDAYSLSASDGGGQYDNSGSGSPPGASCANYKKFVNLVEPDAKRFCIRCCNDESDCNTGESTEGCETIIPGDYS
uniref:Sodium-dependent neutral amino acid transporter B(0)AT1 n=1 Tax=Anthurium amnicola TaxID=1678845 RepID=A0A1D1XWN7_9ARAE